MSTMKKAIPVNPTGSQPGFAKLTDGWLGSGWKSQYNEITARFVEHPDNGPQAQISYEITQHHEKRSQTMLGHISLNEEQAIELAKSILPPKYVEALESVSKEI